MKAVTAVPTGLPVPVAPPGAPVTGCGPDGATPPTHGFAQLMAGLLAAPGASTAPSTPAATPSMAPSGTQDLGPAPDAEAEPVAVPDGGTAAAAAAAAAVPVGVPPVPVPSTVPTPAPSTGSTTGPTAGPTAPVPTVTDPGATATDPSTGSEPATGEAVPAGGPASAGDRTDAGTGGGPGTGSGTGTESGSASTAPATASTPSPPTTGPGAVAAPTTAPVSGPAGTTPAGSRTPVVDQLLPEVTRLASSGDGVHRITMKLQPEALGEVRVTLTVRHGEVQVRLAAGDEAQRSLIEAAPELRRVLEASGAAEARVVVRDLQPGSTLTPTSTGPLGHDAAPGGDDPQRSGDAAASHQGRGDTPDQHARTRGGTDARDGLTDGAPLRPGPARRDPHRGLDLTM